MSDPDGLYLATSVVSHSPISPEVLSLIHNVLLLQSARHHAAIYVPSVLTASSKPTTEPRGSLAHYYQISRLE
ncbi:hypothetical protein FRB95_005308 [Tulasnella sp. JGI-2019a]|nr:hypothetical protein FRB95_005308 [Tulasnella sp. JGI-2019a]